MKKLIWIMGSMGSGKTTQRKLLFNLLGNEELIETTHLKREQGDIMFVKSGIVVTLGSAKGMDDSYGKMTKAGLADSYRSLAWDHDIQIVLLEGAQASTNWYTEIIQPSLDYVELFLVHLRIDFDDNMNRIKQRKLGDAFKQQGDLAWVKLDDAKFESVIGKNKQYRSTFKKIQSFEDKNAHFLEIEATSDKFDILEQILNFARIQ